MRRPLLLAVLVLSPSVSAQTGRVSLDESEGEMASDHAHYADPADVSAAATARVLSVVIDRVPPSKPNGRGWDVATGPDLEVQVMTTDGYEYARSDGPLVQDVTGERLPVHLVVEGPEVAVDQQLVVRVFDHDRTGSDLMFRTETFSAAGAQARGGIWAPLRTWTGHVVGRVYFDFGSQP